MSRILTHLWFAREAVEAANFYVSLLPDSRIDAVTDLPADSPAGPAGSVQVVEFTLAGQLYMAINAGPLDPFNHAISLVVLCDTQAEIDRRLRKAGRHIVQVFAIRDAPAYNAALYTSSILVQD